MHKPFIQSQWIWTEDEGDLRFAVRRFRGYFTIGNIRDIIITITADSRYILYIDGKLIGRGPARSDLRHYIYENYSLQLTPGKHVVAVLVQAYSTYTGPVAEMKDRGALRLEITSTDDTILLSSGIDQSQWKSHVDTAYHIQHQKIGAYYVAGPSYLIDGSSIPQGWNQLHFDDSKWESPVTIEQNDVRWRLEPRDIPMPCEEVKQFLGNETVFPLHVQPGESKEIILDNNQYAIGYPQLSVSGGAGNTIILHYAEAMTINGSKSSRNYIDDGDVTGIYDTFITGEGNDVMEPLHWRAFRFIKLTAEADTQPLIVNNLSFISTGYPWNLQSKFIVENAPDSLKKMMDVDFHTLSCCTWETFMDCPYYEQLQYVGDTRLQALLSYVTTGDTRLGRRAVQQFYNSRIPEGLTQSRFPSVIEQIIPPFSLMWILMVEDLYRYSPEDVTLVAQCLNTCRGILEWFGLYLTPEGIIGGNVPFWNFVDWTWDWGVPNPQRNGQPSATINLQYLAALQAYIRLNESMGDSRESEFWQAENDMLTDAITLAFWNNNTCLLNEGLSDEWGYTQHAQAWGILTGIIPEEAIDKVIDHLHTNPALDKATFYHTFYIIEALAKVGKLEKLWSHWLAPWREALDMGFTTWPENPEPTRSDCHAWSSWPTYSFITHVLGVSPDGPGFIRYNISPKHIDGWDHVKGCLPIPSGKLAVEIDWCDQTPKIKAELK